MTEVEESVEARIKGRILIVDDETVVRDSLGKWFSSEGYEAQPVAGGREALKSIQDKEYDMLALLGYQNATRAWTEWNCRPG